MTRGVSVGTDTRTAESRAAEVIDLASQIHALEAQLVDAAARFDEAGGWEGYRSLSHWLSVNAGFTSADAQARARSAAARETMPAVMTAAREGRVSASVVAQAAQVATVANQAQLAADAVLLTPTQFRRLIAQFRRLADPTDERTDPPTWWRSHWDRDGRLRVSAALDAETGALLQAGLDAACRLLEPEGESHCRPTHSDAVAELAGLAIDSASATGRTDEGGDRFGVLVTVDLTALIDDDTTPLGARLVGSDVHLEAETVRRLSCDSRVQTLVTAAGVPLSMGRERRVPTRHQRRALMLRDGGCAFPGCGRRRRLHAHHVVHWARGGPTDLENLVLLCPYHHRTVHEGGWTVSVDASGRHTWTPPARPQAPPELRARRRRRCPVEPDAARPTGHGERLTGYALDVLVSHLMS